MKIVFVYPRFHTNSIGWVDALNRHGINVTILVMYRGLTEDYGKISPKMMKSCLLTKLRYQLNRKNKGNMDYLKKIYFPSIPYVIQTIIREKPDIVICRDRSATALIFCLVCKIAKIKTIIYDQTPWLEPETKIKKWITHKFFSCYVMKPLTKNKPKKLNHNEFYIPFAVSEQISPEKKEYKKEKINFIAVGKYEPRKNLLLLIDIVKQLTKKYNISLQIIGEVSTKHRQNYYNAIIDKIQSENLENIVFLLKNIQHNEMNRYFEEADVFLLPSIQECASVSQLEAMAFGLPVIVGSDNGTAEYVENNKSGKIVDINEPCVLENNKALEKAMVFYCENTEEIQKQGEYARNLVNTQYSIDAVYARFDDMIKKVMFGS